MGIDDESKPPQVVFRSCRRCRTEHRVSFPRAGCGKSACPVRRAGTGNRTKPNRTEVARRKPSRLTTGRLQLLRLLFSTLLPISPTTGWSVVGANAWFQQLSDGRVIVGGR